MIELYTEEHVRQDLQDKLSLSDSKFYHTKFFMLMKSQKNIVTLYVLRHMIALIFVILSFSSLDVSKRQEEMLVKLTKDLFISHLHFIIFSVAKEMPNLKIRLYLSNLIF